MIRRTVVLAALAACQGPPVTSTSAQDSVVVFPLIHDFGSAQVGTQLGPFPITVDPDTGANDDLVTAVTASCPNFIISAPDLPYSVYRTCDTTMCAANCFAPICTTLESQSYTFETYFHPIVAQQVSCVVTVTTNYATNRTISLVGTGTVPPIDIDIAPTSIAFGDVRRNTTSTPVSVAVRNLGGTAMTVSSASASAGFALAGGPAPPYTIAPGASQAYAATCTPTALGTQPGSLVFASDDPTTPATTIPLSCNGIDSTIDLAPSPAVIAATRVGEPVQTTITVTNSGTASSTLQSIAVTGDMTLVSGPASGTVLAPGASAPVAVAFAATTSGAASGTLAVTYDSGLVRTTQIAASALATSMSLAPDGEVDFGPVCIGQHRPRAFTIVADDQGSFVVDNISPPAQPFAVELPALPAVITGNGATTLGFTVTASPVAEGEASATVAVATDIPNAAPRALTLLVTGLGAGVTPTPSALDLGSHPLDTTTLGRSVSVTNCSAAPITTTNPRIEGPDARDFAIVAQPDSPQIPPAGIASWLIVLAPHTAGVKHAMFAVDHDAGTATVELDGEGLGATPLDLGPASYYACSTSGGAAGWPIALVLFAVLRSRRDHPLHELSTVRSDVRSRGRDRWRSRGLRSRR